MSAVQRKCRHCGRGFKNQQAVRAHLRWCEPWLQRRDKPSPRASVQLAGPAAVRWYRCVKCEHLAASADAGNCDKCGGTEWADVVVDQGENVELADLRERARKNEERVKLLEEELASALRANAALSERVDLQDKLLTADVQTHKEMLAKLDAFIAAAYGPRWILFRST